MHRDNKGMWIVLVLMSLLIAGLILNVIMNRT